jgi:glycosyltransferase involved in cell wall biosynthesis
VILGIDASNIRAGGGVAHLVSLLEAADPPAHGFLQVVLWGGRDTLERVASRPWLTKRHQPVLDRNLLLRSGWRQWRLSAEAQKANCSLLFIPGGSFGGSFRPMIAMSQNMLPFEWAELLRYGWSLVTLRLLTLRFSQLRTFSRADGVIFLTRYGRDKVMAQLGKRARRTVIIGHGVDGRFVREIHRQKPLAEYSFTRPFRLVYVSIIDLYKHQWVVAEAVARLRAEGFPVALTLVGPAYPPALNKLRAALRRFDPNAEFIHYIGMVPHDALPGCYDDADLAVFASSCEAFSLLLAEAMAAGLPVACSDRGPMSELLQGAGIYFNPESVASIADAVRRLMTDMELRRSCVDLARSRVQTFNWKATAAQTFEFFATVVGEREARLPNSGRGKSGE